MGLYNTLFFEFNILVATNEQKSVNNNLIDLLKKNDITVVNPELLPYVSEDIYLSMLQALKVSTFREHPLENYNSTDYLQTILNYIARYELNDLDYIDDFVKNKRKFSLSSGSRTVVIMPEPMLRDYLSDTVLRSNSPYNESQKRLLVEMSPTDFNPDALFESSIQENNFIQFILFYISFYSSTNNLNRVELIKKFVETFDTNNLNQFIKFAYSIMKYELGEEDTLKFVDSVLPRCPKCNVPLKKISKPTSEIINNVLSRYIAVHPNYLEPNQEDLFRLSLKKYRESIVGIFKRAMITDQRVAKLLSVLRTKRKYRYLGPVHLQPYGTSIKERDLDRFIDMILLEKNYNKFLQHVIAFLNEDTEDKIVNFIQNHKDEFRFKHLVRLYFYLKFRSHVELGVYPVYQVKKYIWFSDISFYKQVKSNKLLNVLEEIIKHHEISRQLRDLYSEGYRLPDMIMDYALAYSKRHILQSNLGQVTPGTRIRVKNINNLSYYMAWDYDDESESSYPIDLDLSATVWTEQVNDLCRVNWQSVIDGTDKGCRIYHTGDYVHCHKASNPNKVFEAVVLAELNPEQAYILYSEQGYSIMTDISEKLNVYVGYGYRTSSTKSLKLEKMQFMYKINAEERDYRFIGLLDIKHQEVVVLNHTLHKKASVSVASTSLEQYVVKHFAILSEKLGSVKQLFQLLDIEESETGQLVEIDKVIDIIIS